jgi:hypothetical protein
LRVPLGLELEIELRLELGLELRLGLELGLELGFRVRVSDIALVITTASTYPFFLGCFLTSKLASWGSQ